MPRKSKITKPRKSKITKPRKVNRSSCVSRISRLSTTRIQRIAKTGSGSVMPKSIKYTTHNSRLKSSINTNYGLVSVYRNLSRLKYN